MLTNFSNYVKISELGLFISAPAFLLDNKVMLKARP